MFKLFYYNFIFRPIWFILEHMVPKRNDFWAFSTHYLQSHLFIENQRAVFEEIKNNPKIKKIIFYRGSPDSIEIEGACNTEVIEYGTLKSFLILAQCKIIFLTNSISMDYSIRWQPKNFFIVRLDSKQRILVNLWHGIALKRLFDAANENVRAHTNRIRYRRDEREKYAGLIVSSAVDSYAMTTMFYPLRYDQIWLTGLPRNDFLIKPEQTLPTYLQQSITWIKAVKGSKKLVIYAPTYRQVGAVAGAYYYQFNAEEITKLKLLLQENNAILGFRPHYFKNSDKMFNMHQFIDNEYIFDCSYDCVPDIAALIRECDILVTDYSSVYIEALYLSKAIISFAYDFEEYRDKQDGLLYDMELAFPARVNKTFDECMVDLESRLNNLDNIDHQQYKMVKKMFYQYTDDNNSRRVVEKINLLLPKSESAADNCE